MDSSTCSSESESENGQNNNEGVLYLIQNDCPEKNIVEALAKPNVKLNYQSVINGESFLYAAIKKHRADIVKVLIDRGVDATVKIKKKSPLEWIEKLLKKNPGHNQLTTIKQLLENAQPGTSSGTTLGNSTGLKRKADQQDIQNSKPANVSAVLPSKCIRINNKFKASGLKLSLHGVVFQLKLLMLFARRARQNDYSFRLATEMDAAEKFDDVVLEYFKPTDSTKKHLCFLQAKHKNDSDKNKITITNLKSDDDDFSLQKYLISFCKIKSKSYFKDADTSYFYIVTNTDFDFIDNETKKKDVHMEKWRSFFEVDDFDENEVLYFDNDEFQARKYKLRDGSGELKKVLKSNLVKSALKSKQIKDMLAVCKKLNLIDKLNDSPDLHTEATKVLNELLNVQRVNGIDKVWKKDIAVMAKQVLYLDERIFDKRDTAFGRAWAALDGRKRDTKYDINLQKAEVLQNARPLLDEIENELRSLKENLRKYEEKGSVEFQQLENEKLDDHENTLKEKRKQVSKAPDLKAIEKLLDEETIKDKISDETRKMVESAKNSDSNSNLGPESCSDSSLAHLKQILDEELRKGLEKVMSETTLIRLALDNAQFDKRLDDFLAAFRIVTNFPNEENLGVLVSDELGTEFNLLNADLAEATFEQEILNFLKQYHKGEAEFLTRQMSDDFFVKLKAQIDTFMVSGLSRSYPERLREYGINFERKFQGMMDFLSNDSRILHIVTQSTRLAAIKVLDTLDATGNYIKADSLIFMRLTTLLRKETRNRIRSVLSINKSTYGLIVIEIQRKNSAESKSDLFEKLMQFIQKVFINRTGIKIVVVDSRERSYRSLKINCHTENVAVNFADLEESSQKRVLEREVDFQGKNTRINQLMDIKSAAIVIDDVNLEKLLDKMNIKIGDEKPFSSNGYVEDFYIVRKFESPIVKTEVFNEKSELFFVTGLDEENFLQFGIERKRIQKYEDSKKYENGIVIPCSGSNQDYFDNKAKFQQLGQSVHWFDYSSGAFFWICSKGNSKTLINYIKSDGSAKGLIVYQEGGVADICSEGCCKIMIVANDPGMGKSTVLTSMARKLKGIDFKRSISCDDPWIVRINLNDFAEVKQEQSLHKINFNDDDTAEAVEFVTKMAIPGNPTEDSLIRMQRNLFKIGLNTPKIFNENGISIKTPQIVLMFDGFDEISPRLKAKTTNLIRPLKESEVAQIWVTTRTHEKTHLEQELGAPARDLAPLDLKEQIEFTNEFWIWHLKFGTNLLNGEENGRSYQNIYKNLNDIKSNLPPNKHYTRELISDIDRIFNDFPEESSSDKMDALRLAVDKLDFSWFIEELYWHLEKSIKDKEWHFSKNPLHLRMFAEVVFRMNLRLPKEFGFFNMYNRFIEIKLNDIYYEEKEKIAKGTDAAEDSLEDGLKLTHKIHQALAVQLMLDEQWVNRKLPNLDDLKRFEWEESDETMKEKQKLARKGILCLNGGRLEFIHRSFAEYFLGVYLVENFDDESVQEFAVSEMFLDDKYKLIRQFFNGYLEVNQPKNIKLKDKTIYLMLNCPQKSFLHQLAKENHGKTIEFILNMAQNEDDLYETVLTDIFQLTNIADYPEKIAEQLLNASLKLVPEIIKAQVLRDGLNRNILCRPIREFSFQTIKIILNFLKVNRDKFGPEFFDNFVNCSEIKNSLTEAFATSKFKSFYMQLTKSFKENIPSEIFIELFSPEQKVWSDRHVKIITETVELIKIEPEILKRFVLKTDSCGRTAINNASKLIEKIGEFNEFYELFLRNVNDQETIEDVAILTVYGDTFDDPHTNVERLIDFQLFYGAKKDFEKLGQIQGDLAKVIERKSQLDEAIRDGNADEVLMILEQSQDAKKELLLMSNTEGRAALHVAVESNQKQIVEILLNSLKEYPRFLEEILLKIDRSQQDTALHRAVELGHFEAVQGLFNYLKRFGERELIKKILTKPNKSGKTALQIAFDRKNDSIIEVILECIDGPTTTIDQMYQMGGAGSLFSWMNEKGQSGFKQRLFDQIGPRDRMRWRLFTAMEKIKPDDASDVMRFLNDNKDDKNLKKVLLDGNQEGKTLVDISVGANNYTALDWMVDKFQNDSVFFRKFIYKINATLAMNTSFLNWLKENNIDQIASHVFRNILVEPLNSGATLLSSPIHLNDDYGAAKQLMKWAKQNCDTKTFEEMLLATDSSQNNLLHYVAYRWDKPQSKNFFEFVLEFLVERSDILKKLENKSNKYTKTPLSIIESRNQRGNRKYRVKSI